MRPEPFAAFHQALRFGPAYCPPDLFEGSVPAIVRGLKVHANNIAHARHVALEESYPRLLRAMGLEAFHAVAERFLRQPFVAGRPLDALGEGFQRLLGDPAHRDLACAEWAWLESFCAEDASALTLATLATFEPDSLLAARIRLHPAARWLTLEDPFAFDWDPPILGDGDVLLISRPEAELFVRRMDSESAAILRQLLKPCPVARLLGGDLATLILLIDAGTIVLETAHED